MPFTYHAESRRQFLQRGTLAVAGMTCQSMKASNDDSEIWFLMADCHVAAEPSVTKNNVNMSDNLRAVLKQMNEASTKASHILINGDLALANGQPRDYQALASVLEEMPAGHAPVHLTLGNHDHRKNFMARFPNHGESSVVDKLVLSVEGQQVRWLLLDSLKETDIVEGKMEDAQLQWIKQELAKEPDASFILAGHHPMKEPMPDGFPRFAKGLDDSAALLHLMENSPQIKAYIFGHTHQWGSWQTPAGVVLVNLPPTGYVFDPKQPSGWVEAHITAKGMRLTLRCLDPKHPQQGETKDFTWRTV